MSSLPYPDHESGHSSGWSGTETSRARAHGRDLSGQTRTTQERVLDLLFEVGSFGVTVAEARERLEGHHGTISGALSNLHVDGVICRLVQVRGGCKVYVLPASVNGRDTEDPKPNLNAHKIATFRRLLRKAEARGMDGLPLSVVRAVLEATK